MDTKTIFFEDLVSKYFIFYSKDIQKCFALFVLKIAAQAVKMTSDLKFLHAVVVILKN